MGARGERPAARVGQFFSIGTLLIAPRQVAFGALPVHEGTQVTKALYSTLMLGEARSQPLARHFPSTLKSPHTVKVMAKGCQRFGQFM